MKSIIVLVCVATVASAVSYTKVVYEEWKAFKLEHGKRYSTEPEDRYRMKIYAENKRTIAKHNQLFARGLVGYTQKLNKYSDLSHHEFVTIMAGYNGTTTNTGQAEHESLYEPTISWKPPREVDWRAAGAVTDVKDQEMCASCWAFSATGALEGQHYLRTGSLVSLSEQNLIDCSSTRRYGNNGCNGGSMRNAFNYIRDNRGVDTETSYPYEAMDDRCRYDPDKAGANDVGYMTIPEYEWILKYAVATEGPVSAAIYGSLSSFRHYNTGVYDDKMCTADLMRDHAVLIVGYGMESAGGDYWLVKNSWGPSWGANGYGMIARNRGNVCGIASEASFPIVN